MSKSDHPTIVIVARHGERMDYYLRDFKDSNFLTIPTTTRKFDPPLTNRGRLQGRMLGAKIKEVLNDLNAGVTEKESIDFVGDSEVDATSDGKAIGIVAPLTVVYSSPMMRCVQTAAEAIRGYHDYDEDREHDVEDTDKRSVMRESSMDNLKVRIEPGLS